MVAVVICEASNFIFLVLSVLLNISKSLSFASSIVVAVLNFLMVYCPFRFCPVPLTNVTSRET